MKSLSALIILLVVYHLQIASAQVPALQDTVNSLTSSLTSGLTNGLFNGLSRTLNPGQATNGANGIQQPNGFQSQQQQPMMPFGNQMGQMRGQMYDQMMGGQQQMPSGMGQMHGHWPPPPPPPPHHWFYQQMMQQHQNSMGFPSYQQGGQMNGYPNSHEHFNGQMNYPSYNQSPGMQSYGQGIPNNGQSQFGYGGNYPSNQQSMPTNGLSNQPATPLRNEPTS